MAKRKAKPVKIELPIPVKDRIIVQGEDMGTKNYAVTQILAWRREDRMCFRVLGSKMMHRMIHDVKLAQTECADYVTEYKALPKADYRAAERFQARPGRGAGTTVEAISMMLGASLIISDTPTEFYTAATWKNEFNRTAADLKEMYDDLKLKYKGQGIVIHQLDSFLIALYHAARILRVKPYDYIKSHKDEDRLFRVLMDAPEL